jgi:hypothetical protein
VTGIYGVFSYCESLVLFSGFSDVFQDYCRNVIANLLDIHYDIGMAV